MNQPPILLISHVVPYPAAAGNEVRIVRMLEWLKRQGYPVVLLLNHEPLPAERLRGVARLVDRVHFVGDDYHVALPPPPRTAGFRSIVEQRLSASLPDSWMYRTMFGVEKEQRLRSADVKRYLGSERLVQVTRHLCERYRPCAVLAEYVFAAPCLDVVPEGVLKIIDTHDMFSRKAESVLAHGIEDPLPCTPREERNYLLKSDVVIAIQSHEAGLFRALVPERDVITVGIDFDVAPEIDDREVVPGTLLVVGSDNANNRHGLREFLAHAWPAVRRAHPGVVLRVVGRLADHVQVADEAVCRVGWIPDLDREYRTAAVVINPTVAGTGLKIKSVEALSRGKALVATPASVEGIDAGAEPPYRRCGDWPAFADAVLALLRSDDQRLRLERRALRFAREHFSPEVVYGPLARRLRGVPDDRASSHAHAG